MEQGQEIPVCSRIKGKKYIEEADCIIYDRLASPELLEMAKHDCECIYVGKENHKHIMKQDAINELLYKKSREYSLVVRAKGWCPYVFGRGGEEALYLRKRKIDIEVVPGVSSVVAALADSRNSNYAQRDCKRVSGHYSSQQKDRRSAD